MDPDLKYILKFAQNMDTKKLSFHLISWIPKPVFPDLGIVLNRIQKHKYFYSKER